MEAFWGYWAWIKFKASCTDRVLQAASSSLYIQTPAICNCLRDKFFELLRDAY